MTDCGCSDIEVALRNSPPGVIEVHIRRLGAVVVALVWGRRYADVRAQPRVTYPVILAHS